MAIPVAAIAAILNAGHADHAGVSMPVSLLRELAEKAAPAEIVMPVGLLHQLALMLPAGVLGGVVINASSSASRSSTVPA